MSNRPSPSLRHMLARRIGRALATGRKSNRCDHRTRLKLHSLEDRLALEKRIAEYAAKFGLGEVPRPDYWRGYRLVPLAMEFWRDRPFRLHDRLLFTRDAPGQAWAKSRLYP